MGSDDVVLLASAAQDLDNGEAFYEKRRDGLGQYFLQSIFADLEALKVHASVHAKSPINNLHMMRAKRFPYMIYYRVIDEITHVLAILPTRRSPSWTRELLDQRVTD